ncbi:PorV/PorQ family protein [candidate division KSB1 bacterium]|nr:PorV/PorQ family protein [candidate division KSB1 bacterium]MBL7094662.1 PorV/PorQ family protein [candidate division KSB1 bacterium]
MRKKKFKITLIILISLSLSLISFAQEPTRVGTTAAAFLEYGYGASGSAMGDAYVSVANDLSSVYWNPAGLANVENTQVMFVYQPWFADINSSFGAVGHSIRGIGTIAVSLISVNYGDMPVTTLAMQDGTGEEFSASDMAFGLSYGRNLTNWFAFGASAKFITSNIWHTNAYAFATDLGVIINTLFMSPTGTRNHGMAIGMSISNYGTRMQYSGIDLINPIDINTNEAGNFRDVPGQFRLSQWELPLIFRIGVSITPMVTDVHKFMFSIDALHPNNNAESVNLGAEYSWTLPGMLKFSFRGGYKALYMPESIYGVSFGFGIETFLLHNTSLKVDYAYRDTGIFGGVSSLGFAFEF